jgi:hypothetical protein
LLREHRVGRQDIILGKIGEGSGKFVYIKIPSGSGSEEIVRNSVPVPLGLITFGLPRGESGSVIVFYSLCRIFPLILAPLLYQIDSR